MLQPPPFLGNPSLDLLCFVTGVTDTEHSTPGSSGLTRTMWKNGLPQAPGTLVQPTVWLLLLLEKYLIPFPGILNKNQVSGCKIFKQPNPEFPLSRVKHSTLLPFPVHYEENGSVIKDNYQVYKEPRVYQIVSARSPLKFRTLIHPWHINKSENFL